MPFKQQILKCGSSTPVARPDIVQGDRNGPKLDPRPESDGGVPPCRARWEGVLPQGITTPCLTMALCLKRTQLKGSAEKILWREKTKTKIVFVGKQVFGGKETEPDSRVTVFFFSLQISGINQLPVL